MSQPWICIRIRKLPNKDEWTVHKLYPKQYGVKCRGLHESRGSTIVEAVDKALVGIREQLIARAKVRGT